MIIDETEILFTTNTEKLKRNELCKLFNDWKESINKKSKIKFKDDNKYYKAINYFNCDGFWPGYYSAAKKILFIGRESRYSSGNDRVKTDIEGLVKNSPNSSSYWRRIFYITYGIKTEGKFKFSEIPYADEIMKEMIETNNYGFALMNISKYSNDSDSGANADYTLINQFLVDSNLIKRNFIREEIELLEPDLILTANLWSGNINRQELDKVFPEKDFEFINEITDKAVLFNFKLRNKKIELIDLYHFSSRGSDQDLFYDPVINLLFH